MGDQMILEEPSAKKAKMGSPSLMTPSNANDPFDWAGSVLDLPDELLETSASNGPSTSSVDVSNAMINNSTTVQSSSMNISNGPAMNGPVGHSSQFDGGFGSNQPQHQHSTGNVRAPPPFNPNVNSNPGSVLEGLLLNRPSATGPPSATTQLHVHHAQHSSTAPNMPAATANQRTPNALSGMTPGQQQQRFVMSPAMNNLSSPPNGPVSNAPIRAMSVYSDPPASSNVYSGSASAQYGIPPNRLPPTVAQPGLNQTQQIMGPPNIRGPQPSSMNGPQAMNPGMIRVQRPMNMMTTGPPPNQQMMPFNMHMQQQQPQPQSQQQMAQMQMNARMNGPNMPNMHMPNHGSYQQDPHAGQQQPTYGMLPPHQQPPQLSKAATVPAGMRPKAHADFPGLQQAPPPPSMPAHSLSSPYPPQTGIQSHAANPRNIGPRVGFGTSAAHMPNNNSMPHLNASANAEMIGGQHLSNQQPHPNASQGPPLGGLPQQSPIPSMLMSPPNNILNGAGPLSVPPPTPGDAIAQAVNNASIGIGSGAAPQDPEKRKLIQQQLVLLLHAHKCQQRERTNDQQPCALPHCSTMKGVLTHMTTCTEGRSCTVPHCASSRQIIAHWKSCIRPDCPVCLPLKQMTDNKNNRGAVPGSTNGPLSLESNSVNGSRMFGRPTATSAFDSLLGPNAPENAPAQNQLRGAAPVRQQLPASVNAIAAAIGPGSMSGAGGSDCGGGGFTPRWPPPEGASVQKEWHKQVTIDLRNHLVSKLVKAIFPSPDPAAMHDQRIKDLIQYARKVEKEMFELANDREEYYHLLAEKIYKIQKELQEKKQRRLEQANRSQYPPDPGGPASALGIASALAYDLTPAPNRTIAMDSMHKAPATAAALATNLLGANANQSAVNGGNLASGVSIKEEVGGGGAACRGSSSAAMKFEPGIVKTEVASMADGERPSTSAAEQGTESKSVVKASKKTFTVEELKNALLPIWDKLERMDDAIPFRVPVDPDLLGIPDYFDIIKHPMDLSTIKEKLLSGEYTDPWQFCDDMWLMFENAWSYNRKNSKVYKYCTKLSETFVDDMDPVMRSLGYCCGRKLAFTPLALLCYGQPMCSIPRDAIYYCYEDNKSQFGVSSERYTYCKKCFEELPGDSINMSDDPNSDNLIHKKNFKQLKNDQIEYEPFVDCAECGRKWHQICALHMDQIYLGGFVCETCLKMKVKKRSENRFTAKRLAHCKLSLHLEKRVNDFLKNKVPPDQSAGEVIIRVLSSSDKEVEVKPHMKSKFCTTGQFPEKFPYRAKAIFAFEVIDGVEVCFFGLHVQEFGSNCPAPNQRRVYVAYLDSVHFFTPKSVRTQVYHELLLGYLDYVKKLGYTMAHIWACPPSEGDDYIFHCHPPEQKIPKPKRLQEWYKKLLDRGIVERTVTDYKDIYEFYQKEEVLNSVTELPFFEGDYWPNVIEECIREVDNEEAERKREAEAQAAAGTGTDDLEDDADEIFGSQGKKRNAKGHKKSKSKSKSTNYKKSKKGGAGTGNDLTDKIVSSLEKHKEVFFVVRLFSKQSAAALPGIVDPDPHITCEFMDGRDSFLSTARDRHWEFSSLRRAKFSTLALCYELHTQGSDKFVYTCNTCKNSNAKWHCSECDDFDLCQGCYEKTNHEHKMEQIKSIMADDTTSSQEQGAQNPRDRNESIQRCIQSLVHACQCRDANCRRLSCHKMKRVVQHTKMCKKRQSGSCPVCKQLIALCLYHARHCQEGNCPVPFCQNIRQKLAEQQAQLKKKRDREMMRRINFMSNQATAGPSNAMGGAPSTPYQQHQPQQSPVPLSSMVSPTASGTSGAIPGQPMANPAALLVARDIEKIAQQQQQQANAGLYQGVGGNRMQGLRPPGAMGVSGVGPGRLPVASMPPSQQPMWDTGKPRGYHPQQAGPMSAMQQQQNRMPPPMGPRLGVPGPDGMPAPAPPNSTLSPQQQQKVTFMLEKMKSARLPEERDMIFREMQQDPLVLQTILRAFKRSGHQPPSQLQQQVWNGNVAPPAVGGQQPRPLQPQQQYYGNSGPAGVRMMQQQQSPQAFQQMQGDMNGPRHMAYSNAPNYGGQQGGMYGNAGLRQPVSPLPSANILNQVRSPQTSMASPGGIHSPHIGAPSMMHMQQQLPANIMADQGGGDVLGDQDKFL